jgi:predicted nucleic-acid-binding Zn-ribbon protein
MSSIKRNNLEKILKIEGTEFIAQVCRRLDEIF